MFSKGLNSAPSNAIELIELSTIKIQQEKGLKALADNSSDLA